MHILDGKRVAELAVSSRELALEVGGPGVVGLGRDAVGSAWMPTTGPLAPLRDEVVAAEDVVDGRPRGEIKPGAAALEVPENLLGTVVWMSTPDIEDRVDDAARRGRRRALRPRGPVLEPRWALLLEALQPLVACGPADAIAPTEGAEALQAALCFGDEASTFLHDMDLPERHRSPPVRCRV